MIRLLLAGFLYVLCICQIFAKGLLVSVRYDGCDMIDDSLSHDVMKDVIDEVKIFVANDASAVGTWSEQIENAVNNYHKNNPESPVYMMTDRKTTFIGLDVASRCTFIKALITRNGALTEGVDFLYDDYSLKLNVQNLDSISFSRTKENHLESIYNMIISAKEGKKIKLQKNADKNAQELFAFIKSKYGWSVLNFPLEDCLKNIKTELILLQDDKLPMINDMTSFAPLAYRYGIKYSFPFLLSDDKSKNADEINHAISYTIEKEQK